MKSTYPTYNPSEEYFIEYRNLLKLKNEKEKYLDNLHQLAQKTTSEIANIKKEIIDMQKIITIMIDQGRDPVDIKLSTDYKDRRDNLWINKENTSDINALGCSTVTRIQNVTYNPITNLPMSMPTTIAHGAPYPSLNQFAASVYNGGSINNYGNHGVTGKTTP